MPKLINVLKTRNINLKVEVSSDYQKSNALIINNKKLKLYTEKELEDGTFWKTSSHNFFRRINEILTNENSKEQFYLLYSGNDLAAILLTENQFKIIEEYYRNDKQEIPYLP